MPTDICLQVLKLSSATGTRPDNIIPWTHLHASNVFVIVKGNDTHIPDGRLVMRIVQGTSVMESIAVSDHVDAAISVRRRSEYGGVGLSVEQLPIFAITKESLLAIRYRLEDGQVRRLQLRMQSASECRSIVDVLERRGMEMHQQYHVTARPATSMSSTDATPNSLPTAPSSFSYIDQARAAERPHPFTSMDLEAGSLSRRDLPAKQPPGSSSGPGVTFQNALMNSTSPGLLDHNNTAVIREATLPRPRMTSVCHSYPNPPRTSQSEFSEAGHNPSVPTGEQPLLSSHFPVRGVRPEPAKCSAAPPVTSTSSSMPPPEIPLSSSEAHWSSETGESYNPKLFTSDPMNSQPSAGQLSITCATSNPDTLEHEIPPRRELPFGRANSRHGKSNTSNLRPNTSAMHMPPLPKPTLVSHSPNSSDHTNTVQSNRELSSVHPSAAYATTQNQTILSSEAEMARASIRPTSNTSLDNSRNLLPSRPPAPASKATSPEAASRKPTKMDDLLSRTKPLAERSIHVPASPPLRADDVPHEPTGARSSVRSRRRDRASPSPRGSQARDPADATIGAYAAIRSFTDDPKVVSVEDYAEQSLQDRQAALDEFMVEMLERPAFTKLCEDVENCWRRIALGL